MSKFVLVIAKSLNFVRDSCVTFTRKRVMLVQANKSH